MVRMILAATTLVALASFGSVAFAQQVTNTAQTVSQPPAPVTAAQLSQQILQAAQNAGSADMTVEERRAAVEAAVVQVIAASGAPQSVVVQAVRTAAATAGTSLPPAVRTIVQTLNPTAIAAKAEVAKQQAAQQQGGQQQGGQAPTETSNATTPSTTTPGATTTTTPSTTTPGATQTPTPTPTPTPAPTPGTGYRVG